MLNRTNVDFKYLGTNTNYQNATCVARFFKLKQFGTRLKNVFSKSIQVINYTEIINDQRDLF